MQSCHLACIAANSSELYETLSFIKQTSIALNKIQINNKVKRLLGTVGAKIDQFGSSYLQIDVS